MKNPDKGTVRIVALGCAKNLVDTERVAGRFLQKGWTLVGNGASDVVVVTTCGFIAPAAQESVNTLLEEIEAKKRGEIKILAAAGCLPERYREDLVKVLKELDLVVGVYEMNRLPEMVEECLTKKERRWEFSSRGLREPVTGVRILSGSPWSTYLKIADGCNNGCSFCTIPRIRGAERSTPIETLVEESRALVRQGVLELSLVAQDLSAYGRDLYGRKALPQLLENLDAIDGLRWIRLLYAHPAQMDSEIIEAMAALPKVLPYLDIPFQHVSDKMLEMMRRRLDKAGHEALLDQLRGRIPTISLRTTMLVGAPGESEEDFEELAAFIEKWRFEHLGAFVFSREENTPAYHMPDQVNAKVAERRLDRLMTIQQKISKEILAARVGETIDVLIESELSGDFEDGWKYIGRCVHQAPEIDGVTYLNASDTISPEAGTIVKARIEKASEYDLYAEVVGTDS